MDPLSGFGAGGIRPGNSFRTAGKNLENSADGIKPSFSSAITDALSEVDRLQAAADNSIEKVASGDAESLHEVMIAFEQARLSMQLLVEVRNKLVETYQEVSRMPL